RAVAHCRPLTMPVAARNRFRFQVAGPRASPLPVTRAMEPECFWFRGLFWVIKAVLIEERIMSRRVKAGSGSNSQTAVKLGLFAAVLTLLVLGVSGAVQAQTATDPGVRGGAPGAGAWYTNLTSDQQAEFEIIFSNFVEQNEVHTSGTGDGGDV